LVVAALLAAAPARADGPVVIKLGTLAPAGSSWHKSLQELARRWDEASGGRVKLKIYPGMVLGDERDMIRKMRIGQLGAASITDIGMHDICPEPQALSAPMLIESDAELDYIFPKVRPKLDERLAKEGFIAVQWAQVGYVRFFCRAPVKSFTDMQQAKLFAWDADPPTAAALLAAGLRPVTLSTTDVMPSLQTGMIDCAGFPPVYIFAARFNDTARKMTMTDVKWNFITAATLITRDAWEKVPAELRPKLLAIAEELGQASEQDTRKLNGQVVEIMKGEGLEVDVPPDLPLWRKAAQADWAVLREQAVPAPFFDEVKRLHDEFHAHEGAAH
jgi:TRAP-type C4-dicarboxylate transport system substrate-binding protein